MVFAIWVGTSIDLTAMYVIFSATRDGARTVYIRDLSGFDDVKRSLDGSLPAVLPVELADEKGPWLRMVLKANPRIPNDIGVRFDDGELNQKGVKPLEVVLIIRMRLTSLARLWPICRLKHLS